MKIKSVTAVIKNLQCLKSAAVGSGILLLDVTWFHIGCFDVSVFRVTLSVGPVAIVVRSAYANGFPVVRDCLVVIILRT
jgi:hypothetical protein